MQRSVIGFGHGIETQIESFQRKFTATDNERSTRTEPAPVVRPGIADRGIGSSVRRSFFRGVVQRIEHLNNQTLMLNGIGNVNHSFIQMVQRFSQISFSVARHAINQERFTSVDGRPNLTKNLVGHHHVLVTFLQHVHGQPGFTRLLTPHNIDILIQRDWSLA